MDLSQRYHIGQNYLIFVNKRCSQGRDVCPHYPRAGSALGKKMLSEPASCQALFIRLPSGPCHQDTLVSEPASLPGHTLHPQPCARSGEGGAEGKTQTGSEFGEESGHWWMVTVLEVKRRWPQLARACAQPGQAGWGSSGSRESGACRSGCGGSGCPRAEHGLRDLLLYKELRPCRTCWAHSCAMELRPCCTGGDHCCAMELQPHRTHWAHHCAMAFPLPDSIKILKACYLVVWKKRKEMSTNSELTVFCGSGRKAVPHFSIRECIQIRILASLCYSWF